MSMQSVCEFSNGHSELRTEPGKDSVSFRKLFMMVCVPLLKRCVEAVCKTVHRLSIRRGIVVLDKGKNLNWPLRIFG